jgi:DNA-binding MarR family transcriptional regulator
MANREFIRAVNRSTVLNLIKTHGPISRTDIARLSGLSLATVSGITADLIAEDLVYEKEEGESTGGRRPILLALNHRARYVIGIKLMERQVIAAMTDFNATVLYRATHPLEDGGDVERTVEALAETVEGLIAGAEIDREKVVGVGIGLAGVIDSARGVCRYSPILNWRNVPLRDLLEAGLGIPVYIDNDVNTLTMAEKLFGAGQEVDDFLTVTVGRGVGMGIVANGQFYRGTRGEAANSATRWLIRRVPSAAVGSAVAWRLTFPIPLSCAWPARRSSAGNYPSRRRSYRWRESWLWLGRGMRWPTGFLIRPGMCLVWASPI